VRRTSDTLINNNLAKERAFYCLNERFVSNICGDIIYSTRSSECFKHGYITFILEEKITKVEQRAIETLTDNSLVKRRAFYRLNERFVSNITGDLSFFQRGSSDDTSQTT